MEALWPDCTRLNNRHSRGQRKVTCYGVSVVQMQCATVQTSAAPYRLVGGKQERA